MKSIIAILSTLFLGIGCSKQVTSSDTNALPQFHIAATDVSTTSVSVVTGQITADPTQETALLHVKLTQSKAGELQRFTKEHSHQKIQILVLGKVTIEPVVIREIASGHLDLPYCGVDVDADFRAGIVRELGVRS